MLYQETAFRLFDAHECRSDRASMNERHSMQPLFFYRAHAQQLFFSKPLSKRSFAFKRSARIK